MIARLLLHYRGMDLPVSAQEMIAEDWLEDLGEFDIDVIQFACREWRQAQRHRPTPADIRLLAIAEHRRRNPIPEPPYIPPPAPRHRTPEDIAAVEANMRIFFERNRKAFSPEAGTTQAQINEAMGVAATERKPTYEDPEALRRGRIELGLEEP